MKKSLIIATISSSLLIMGCAQKEVNTIGVSENTNGIVEYATVDDTTNSNGYINENKYENVDLYDRDGGQYTYNSVDGYGGAGSGIKNIYFSSDQYNITSDKLHIVRSNARVLNPSVNSGSRVKIEGHCDATGTDEYNYALGLRRASSAKNAIVSSGIRASSITVVSMGESSPECTTGYSSACYAKNR